MIFESIVKKVYHLRTDCYVLSYPKCGRTWLRFMLGNALVNHFGLKDASLDEILMVKDLPRHNSAIPRIRFTHDDLPHWKMVRDIETEKSKYQSKKVIFLIRDPRDLVVSNYYQKKYRGFKYEKGIDKKNFLGDISEFIRYEYGGLPNIVSYYNIWQQQMNVPKSFQIIKYEDLKQNPLPILKSVFDLLGISQPSEETFKRAIEESTFEKMRQIEEQNVLNNQRLGRVDAGKEEGLKTRKGKVGSYKEELSEGDIAWMEDYISANLSDYYSYYKK